MRYTTILFGIDDANPSFDRTRPAPEWKLLDSLFESYPKLRVTHFVPSQYALRHGVQWGIEKKFRRLLSMPLGIRPSQNASIVNNPDWCRRIQSHPNYAIELHGLYHVHFESGSAEEFLGLSRPETMARIQTARQLFSQAGFKSPTVLSPPGWAVTDFLLEALQTHQMSIAGNFCAFPSARTAGWQKPGIFDCDYTGGVCNIPRNVSIESFNEKSIDELIHRNALISLHGHFRNIGVRNGITCENIENVRNILQRVESQSKMMFRFFEEVIPHARNTPDSGSKQ